MVCCQGNVKICGKSHKQHKSCITTRPFDDLLLIAFTQLKWSHRISTGCWESCGSHAIQLSTINTSSLAIIPYGAHSLSHSHCSHCSFMKGLQPQKPEASICICMNGKSLWEELEFVEHTRTIPALNKGVSLTEDQNFLFRLVKKWTSFTLATVAYIQATKVLPYLMTFVACWSSPTRERMSLFVADFFLSSEGSERYLFL